jgi:L-arabinose transport system permease protein
MAADRPIALNDTSGNAAGNLRQLWENAGMLVVFVILFIALSIFVENFLTLINMKGLMLAVTTVGLISCTMMLCLAAGDFDLSIGSVVAFAGVLAAVVTNSTGSAVLGILAGIVAGGAVGLVNGVVIACIGINALITTLATMQIVRGLAFLVSDGQAVGVGVPAFFRLGNSHLLSIPTPIWILFACFVAFGFVLNRMVFGRNALAIGGNREAAHLAGISVTRAKIIIFTLQGMMAGFAGVILASRMTSGQPNTSLGLELKVISACVLGGVSLTGGIATITGVVVGVMIMGTVENALNLLNVPTFWQYVVSGSILLAAVIFDKLKARTSR